MGEVCFPRFCPGCGEPLLLSERPVCLGCLLLLPRRRDYLLPDPEPYRLFHGRLPLTHAWSFLNFETSGIVQGMLHALKYKDAPEVGLFLGQRFAEELNGHIRTPPDALVPIPLHPQKLKKRGYNQSERFASGLSGELGIPVEPGWVSRQQMTASQTRKSREQRWANVAEAFAWNNPEALAGKSIWLVDDVITTGATLEACALGLLRKVPCSIGVVTIAYTI